MCAVRDLSDLIAVNVAEFALDPSLCATGEDAAYGVGVGGVKVDFDGVAAAYGEYEGAACESGATAANREQVHCADLCKQFLCLRVIHVVPFWVGSRWARRGSTVQGETARCKPKPQCPISPITG